MIINCLKYYIENSGDVNYLTYLDINNNQLQFYRVEIKSGESLPQINLGNWPNNLRLHQNQIIKDFYNKT